MRVLVEGHHAELVGRAPAPRRRAGSPPCAMSTFSNPRCPDGLAVSRESPVQWQSAMLPDLSTTATIATSGRALAVAHRHVDRQRLLERRVEVATGAVAVAAAEHDEPLAEVADVDLERGHGRRPRARSPRRCRARPRRSRRAWRATTARRSEATTVTSRLPSPRRRDEVGGPLRVVGGDQHLRLAGDEDVGIGGVVLGEAVVARLDHRAEDVEAGLVGGHRERDGRDPRLELQLPGGDRRRRRPAAAAWRRW